jgi:hypothetical protein
MGRPEPMRHGVAPSGTLRQHPASNWALQRFCVSAQRGPLPANWREGQHVGRNRSAGNDLLPAKLPAKATPIGGNLVQSGNSLQSPSNCDSGNSSCAGDRGGGWQRLRRLATRAVRGNGGSGFLKTGVLLPAPAARPTYPSIVANELGAASQEMARHEVAATELIANPRGNRTRPFPNTRPHGQMERSRP